jgi:tetratricopeptide (TPR) repeat protein
LDLADALKAEPPPGSGALPRIMAEWQQAAAVFAGVKVSAPTAAQIARAIEAAVPGAVGAAWSELWHEANAVRFGAVPKLPAGWAHRARAAVAAAPLPGVPWHRLFWRRNLFPTAALLVLALLPTVVRAEAGAESYRQGNFAAAEQAWAEAARKEPTNAVLRYNLSLAAAQQDRWAEAAAQALAAFCLDPSSPAIRWQLQLALDRAGIDHPFLTPLAHGTGFGAVARWCSPAGWGWIAVLASGVFAAALGVLASAAYGQRPAAWRWPAAVVAVLAFLGTGTAWVGLHAYGRLADGDTVVVAQSTLLASVPTEADTGQKTVPLPAGSLAQVDQRFLTWSRLRFANGQTGWVRTRLLVPLYAAPAE